MGVRQRRGKVRAKVVPNVHGDTVREVIRENVEPGEKLFTDACGAYRPEEWSRKRARRKKRGPRKKTAPGS